LSDSSYLLSGNAVTGFSNTKEESSGNAGKVLFALETELDRVSGGLYEKVGKKWTPKVTGANDGRLITGQNPGSSILIGEAIYHSLFARNSTGHGLSRGRL
jgi:putative intracellular protease/amidase